ncbi:MAG: MauE/DoxX family redox-associated membrane protein [Anaerolineales bacterium]
MSDLLAHPYAVLLARLVLGLVFLRSGLGKVFDRRRTVQSVVAYDILPESIARVYGVLLPWVELTLAGLLLTGLWTQAAAYGLSLLLVSFGIAVSINLIRHKEMDCGCAGRGAQEKLSWRTLVRVIVLFMLAVGASWLDSGYFSLDEYIPGNYLGSLSPPLRDFLPVLLTTLSLTLSFRLFDAVLEMLREHQLLWNQSWSVAIMCVRYHVIHALFAVSAPYIMKVLIVVAAEEVVHTATAQHIKCVNTHVQDVVIPHLAHVVRGAYPILAFIVESARPNVQVLNVRGVLGTVPLRP